MNASIYCLEVKGAGAGRGRGGEVGYLPSGSNEVKACAHWSRLLVDCFDGMLIVGCACVQICWRWAH